MYTHPDVNYEAISWILQIAIPIITSVHHLAPLENLYVEF